MKTKNLLLMAGLAVLLAACGGNAEKQNDADAESKENSKVADYSQMQLVSLSEYNIPAEIYIPNENKGKAMINENPAGGVEIIVGDRFGIEIFPFGLTKEEMKAELENDLVYSIEYIEEDDKSMLYKKSIKDSDIDPEFHFFLEAEIKGDIYEVKSINQMEFKESAAKEMLKAAKSLQAI
ncbi:MAG: hypothetical protein WD530_00025 [Vicingaceae bacterium]